MPVREALNCYSMGRRQTGSVKMDFEKIWNNIVSCQGQTFYKIGGQPFTYIVDGSAIIPNCAKQRLTKANFAKCAEDIIGSAGPGAFSNLVRGSSYVWAILNDDRIKQNQSAQNNR